MLSHTSMYYVNLTVCGIAHLTQGAHLLLMQDTLYATHLYRRTGNDCIPLVLNHHNFSLHLAIDRSHEINKHLKWCVLSTETRPFVQSFVWATNGCSIASSAPVDTPVFPQGNSVLCSTRWFCFQKHLKLYWDTSPQRILFLITKITYSRVDLTDMNRL